MQSEIINQLNSKFELVSCVRQFGTITRGELAEHIDLSLPTLAKELQGAAPFIASECGNKQPPLRVRAGAFYTLGLSIGSGYIKASLLDACLRPVPPARIHELFNQMFADISRRDKNALDDMWEGLSRQKSGAELGFCFYHSGCLTEIRDCLNRVTEAFVRLSVRGLPLLSVGYAFSGKVDLEEQKILKSYGIPRLDKRFLTDLLSNELLEDMKQQKIHYSCQRNASACIVAEKFALYDPENLDYRYRDTQNICSMYLGSSIWAGLVTGNRLHEGSHALAGDLGHIQLPGLLGIEGLQHFKAPHSEAAKTYFDTIELEQCQCGNWFCLESLLRQRILEMPWEEFRTATEEEILRRLEQNGNRDEFVNCIAMAINMVTGLLDVDAVILTGRLSQIFSRDAQLSNQLKDQVYQCASPYLRGEFEILHSEYDKCATSIGAAILGHYSQFGKQVRWF